MEEGFWEGEGEGGGKGKGIWCLRVLYWIFLIGGEVARD